MSFMDSRSWICPNCCITYSGDTPQCATCQYTQNSQNLMNNDNDTLLYNTVTVSTNASDLSLTRQSTVRVRGSDTLSRGMKSGVHTVQNKINKAGRAMQRAVESTVQHTVGQVIHTVRRTNDNTIVTKIPKLTYHQMQTAARLQAANNNTNESIVQQTLTQQWYTVAFDPLEHILNHDNINISLHTIQEHIDQYSAAQQYNDKQLSDEVIANHTSYVAGVASIDSTQSELIDITTVVSTVRHQVQSIQQYSATQQLHLLYKHRQKQRLLSIVVQVNEILDLISKEQEIQQLLKRQQFINAVQLYKQCIQKLSQSHLQRYECLYEWRSRFIQTSELLNQSVRHQLLLLCTSYNQSIVENVVQAMLSLGEIAMLPELLKTYATKAFNQALNTILKKHYKTNEKRSVDISAVEFDELCRQLNPRVGRDIILSVCELCCNTLYSNHSMIQYITQMYSVMMSMESTPHHSSTTVTVIEQTQQLLLELRQTLTLLMSNRLITILSSIQITKQSIALTAAIQLFNSLYNFCYILAHYSRSNITLLPNTINRKCTEYLKSYHTATIQDIQCRLEGDKWGCIPLHSNGEQNNLNNSDCTVDVLQLITKDTDKTQLCQQCIDGNNPYTIVLQQLNDNTYVQRVSMLRDIRIDCDISVHSINGISQYIQSYLHIATMLPKLAVDCIQCIKETYELYVYTVFCYFGIAQARFFNDQYKASTDKYRLLKTSILGVKQRVESGQFAYGHYKQHVQQSTQSNNNSTTYSNRLQTVSTKSINTNNNNISIAQSRQNEIDNSKSLTATTSFDLLRNLHRAADVIERGIDNIVPVDKSIYPQLCGNNTNLQIHLPDTLYGVAQRIIAVESILSINNLLHTIHSTNQYTQSTWYNQWIELIQYCTDVGTDLSKYMYRNITPYILRPGEWTERLQQCKLDVRSLNNKANMYVSDILRSCTDSHQKLVQCKLPATLLQQVWSVSIQFLCERLIDEYTATQRKRLTVDGLAQIKTDIDALQHGVQLITTISNTDIWSTINIWMQLWSYNTKQFIAFLESGNYLYTEKQLMYVAENSIACKLIGTSRQSFIQAVEDALVQGQENRRKSIYLQHELTRAALLQINDTVTDIKSELSRSKPISTDLVNDNITPAYNSTDAVKYAEETKVSDDTATVDAQ